MSKFVEANEKIAEKVVDGYKKIEICAFLVVFHIPEKIPGILHGLANQFLYRCGDFAAAFLFYQIKTSQKYLFTAKRVERISTLLTYNFIAIFVFYHGFSKKSRVFQIFPFSIDKGNDFFTHFLPIFYCKRRKNMIELF